MLHIGDKYVKKREVFITWIVAMVRDMFLRQHGYPKPKVLTQLVK
jgi:hypothetical protein